MRKYTWPFSVPLENLHLKQGTHDLGALCLGRMFKRTVFIPNLNKSCYSRSFLVQEGGSKQLLSKDPSSMTLSVG